MPTTPTRPNAFGASLITADSPIDLTIRFFAFWIVVAVLYCVGIATAIFMAPTWIGFIAKATFLVLIVGSCLAIIAFAFKRGGSIVQTAIGAVLALVFSSMLVVAFVIAAVAQNVQMFWMTPEEIAKVGYVMWLMLIGGLVITFVWDRICAAITQKLLAAPGVATKITAALKGDGAVDAPQTQIDLSQNATLIDISITVTAVVAVLWIPLSIMQMVFLPIPVPVGEFLLTVEVMLVCAYVRMGAKLHRASNVQPHLQASAASWSTRLYNASMTVAGYAAVVGIGLIACWGLWRGAQHMWGDAPVVTASRAGHIVAAGVSNGFDYAEEAVGVPATQPAQQVQQVQPTPVEVHKPNTMTKKQKAAAIKKYCDDHPVDQSITCKK